ncbi:transmembrane protein, putative (macronuclear) [Tetrahymena thermophila SB210]|uniref:Transmembrane protein, putative n=1 Tax=Tetrahymena thermophila (strain SB210) TaxID=312017 RepID=W7XFG6_TETTS|nr:transmembrane protein, putative [Tetrahymena thermophila SB210]EWS75568.1 transmembrane protein, putative [Tetrahymena thermophila SB210]|eukprot:XP_012651868.1 transmembrane protein, putative [Tetrahymena thermophila SB210]
MNAQIHISILLNGQKTINALSSMLKEIFAIYIKSLSALLIILNFNKRKCFHILEESAWRLRERCKIKSNNCVVIRNFSKKKNVFQYLLLIRLRYFILTIQYSIKQQDITWETRIVQFKSRNYIFYFFLIRNEWFFKLQVFKIIYICIFILLFQQQINDSFEAGHFLHIQLKILLVSNISRLFIINDIIIFKITRMADYLISIIILQHRVQAFTRAEQIKLLFKIQKAQYCKNATLVQLLKGLVLHYSKQNS